MLGGLIGGGLGLIGSIIGGNKQEDMYEESRELPDWLKPYITGNGPTPSYIDNDPLINTNWMDYVMRLGQGDTDAQWAPMTGNSPWFNPDKTFTPDQGGGPYGQLPPGFDPYGQAQQPQQPAGGGMDMDALTSFLRQKKMAGGMMGEMADYSSPLMMRSEMRRLGNDMSYDEFNKYGELAGLLGR